MNATTETTPAPYQANWKLGATYYVWIVTSEASKRFAGCVDAMGVVGALSEAQQRFGLHNHYEIRKWKSGGRVFSTW